MAEVGGSNPSQSTKVNYSTSQTLGSYSTIHWEIFDETMSGEEFKCENCGLTLSTKEDLEEHMKQHKRAAELFRCERCKMSFQSKDELEKHMRELHGK